MSLRGFSKMTANVLGLCEVAENRSGKFRFRRHVAKANSYLLNYEKKPIKLAFADYEAENFQLSLNLPFCKALVGSRFSCHLHLFTCSTVSSNCAANDFTLDFKSIFLPSSVLVKIKSQEPTSLSHWFLKYSAKFLLRPSISGTE